MSSAYVLSKAAVADLRQIVRYTRQQWGHGQVLSYMHQLQTSITRLAANPSVGKDLSDLYPGLRVLHCQHHYVFLLAA